MRQLVYPKRHNICPPPVYSIAMSDPTEAVTEVTHRVENTETVDIDVLTKDTVSQYTNQWDLRQCFDVIDNSECVSARQIGEQQSVGELSTAGGETTVEKEVRHWAAVATVESALDCVDRQIVTETVGV